MLVDRKMLQLQRELGSIRMGEMTVSNGHDNNQAKMLDKQMSRVKRAT